ncbi:MAG: zinc-dependent metalloprotease [Propionibacteriaceae bacterium]
MSDEQSPKDNNDQPNNLFEELFKQLGNLTPPTNEAQASDMAAKLQKQLQAMASQLGSFLPNMAEGESLNWEQTRSQARHGVAALGADPSATNNDQAQVLEATELAESWLDSHTHFRCPATAYAWSRAEWIEATMPTWQQLADPVATHLTQAIEDLFKTSFSRGDATQLDSFFQPMMRRAAGAMLAGSIGQGIGKLAAATVTATDIGLPLIQNRIVFLPTNITEYSEGLSSSLQDIRIYLALREAARQRLFSSVPWLSSQLLALVENYARGIHIDPTALEEVVRDIDGGFDPQQLQVMSERVNGAIFSPASTPQQQEVLERLEVLISLVEGWVDHVVNQAASSWLSDIALLEENTRRRRAVGGAAAEALKTIFGLELSPRRIRDAANLWAALRQARGTAGRDEVWLHPDLIPDTAALNDPLGWVSGEISTLNDDLDKELRQLLENQDES